MNPTFWEFTQRLFRHRVTVHHLQPVLYSRSVFRGVQAMHRRTDVFPLHSPLKSRRHDAKLLWMMHSREREGTEKCTLSWRVKSREALGEDGFVFNVRWIWKDFCKGGLTLGSEIGYPFIIRVPNCWFEFGELCVYRLIPSHLHKLKWRNMWTKFTQLITGNGKLIYNGGWSVVCWVGT